MACFIKRVFEGKELTKVHPYFVRFSKGTFSGRACMNINNSKGVKISSSFEYANDFAIFVSTLGDFKITGKVLSKERLENGSLSSERKKSNIYEYNFEGSSKDVLDFSEKVYFMLLNCNEDSVKLKTKQSLPRPSKSEKKKIDDKFCILELNEKFFNQAKNWFFWDAPENFKKAKVRHNYEIKEIIMPDLSNLKEKDFEKIRIMAKRKGKLTRILEVNGKEMKFEKDFVV